MDELLRWCLRTAFPLVMPGQRRTSPEQWLTSGVPQMHRVDSESWSVPYRCRQARLSEMFCAWLLDELRWTLETMEWQTLKVKQRWRDHKQVLTRYTEFHCPSERSVKSSVTWQDIRGTKGCKPLTPEGIDGLYLQFCPNSRWRVSRDDSSRWSYTGRR